MVVAKPISLTIRLEHDDRFHIFHDITKKHDPKQSSLGIKTPD